MKVVDGKCTAANKCSISNCEVCPTYQSSEMCVLCKTGFSLYPQDKTTFCTETMAGCLSLNFYDKNQCTMCHPNYYFTDGKCTKTTAYTVN